MLTPNSVDGERPAIGDQEGTGSMAVRITLGARPMPSLMPDPYPHFIAAAEKKENLWHPMMRTGLKWLVFGNKLAIKLYRATR